MCQPCPRAEQKSINGNNFGKRRKANASFSISFSINFDRMVVKSQAMEKLGDLLGKNLP